MTDKTRQILKRVNGRAGWAAAAIAGGALAWNVLTGMWGEASASGAQSQQVEQNTNDVETLKGQYGAIRSDLSEIKVRIERIATQLEAERDDGP